MPDSASEAEHGRMALVIRQMGNCQTRVFVGKTEYEQVSFRDNELSLPCDWHKWDNSFYCQVTSSCTFPRPWACVSRNDLSATQLFIMSPVQRAEHRPVNSFWRYFPSPKTSQYHLLPIIWDISWRIGPVISEASLVWITGDSNYENMIKAVREADR